MAPKNNIRLRNSSKVRNLNRSIIIVSILSLVAIFFITKKMIQPKNSAQTGNYQNISVQEFDSILTSKDPFVVDVHTPEQTHIPGTDAFIDFTKVKDRLAEFPQDKDAEILVYCRSGSMSLSASQDLINAGYTNVKNLVGGRNAWVEAHQEVSLTPSTHDFGQVIYGDIPTTQFSLSNNLSQSLNITRLSTSCSCTQAEINQKALEPYQSTTINVSFNPAVHKDDSDLGDITRTIFIETDNPNFKKLEATITANVIKN